MAMMRAPHNRAAERAAARGRPYRASGLWSLANSRRWQVTPAPRKASRLPQNAGRRCQESRKQLEW
eukprot:8238232-Lingulodinium_polyedra.AAC.1